MKELIYMFTTLLTAIVVFTFFVFAGHTAAGFVVGTGVTLAIITLFDIVDYIIQKKKQ